MAAKSSNNKFIQTKTQEATSPGTQLIALKKEIKRTIEEIKKMGGNTESLETTLSETVHKIDNYMGSKLHSGLISRFGDHKWKVTMENYSRPFLSRGSTKNDYRYILKNISWTNGPNPRQVFFFILENFKYYLQSHEFDSRMFQRHLPNIDKRYRCVYIPIPINGKEFYPIEINISKVYNKLNDTVTLQYFIIDAVDNKLDIQNIKGETKEEVFTRFQEALETVYYMPTYTPQYKQLIKNERVSSSSDSSPVKTKTGSTPIATAEVEEEREPGEPSGEDYTDVDSDSIPEENPDISGEVYDPDHDGDVDIPGEPDNDMPPTPTPTPPAKANEGEEEEESYNAEEEGGDEDEMTEAGLTSRGRNTIIFS